MGTSFQVLWGHGLLGAMLGLACQAGTRDGPCAAASQAASQPSSMFPQLKVIIYIVGVTSTIFVTIFYLLPLFLEPLFVFHAFVVLIEHFMILLFEHIG